MKLQGSNILSQEQIDLLLSRGLNFVWFPKTLEQVYRTQYRQAAAHEFRFRAPIILILYSLLSFGIFQVLPQSEIKLWLINYAWVGVIITSAWLLSFLNRLINGSITMFASARLPLLPSHLRSLIF